MSLRPCEVTLNLAPSGRFDVIEIGRTLDALFGGLRNRYRRTLYSSLHTTAGFLDTALVARMQHRRERVDEFFRAFHNVFPQGGQYKHDQMHLRQDLSAEQRQVEPRNGDSHLTFMGAGMRNCVTYSNDPPAPVYFIDLDGENEGTRRRRTARVLGYELESVVHAETLRVPISRHPIDCVNLADPRLGLVERINDLLATTGLEKGRVEIALERGERDVGLTVNEYETLLMTHDLTEVLQDPFRFAALKGRHMLDDPLAIPGKTLNYAKYDFVRVLNSLMDAFHVNESFLERVVAKLMAVPARRFLRSRRVSFLASDHANDGRASLVRGTYQSPILVQWRAAAGGARRVRVQIVRLS
jgi:thiamine phosphate synthase YjbQ (UPF0047 family)